MSNAEGAPEFKRGLPLLNTSKELFAQLGIQPRLASEVQKDLGITALTEQSPTQGETNAE